MTIENQAHHRLAPTIDGSILRPIAQSLERMVCYACTSLITIHYALFAFTYDDNECLSYTYCMCTVKLSWCMHVLPERIHMSASHSKHVCFDYRVCSWHGHKARVYYDHDTYLYHEHNTCTMIMLRARNTCICMIIILTCTMPTLLPWAIAHVHYVHDHS